jgi:hypothetical protein
MIMKINFGHVEFSYENIDSNEDRLKRISNLVLKILDEKLSEWIKGETPPINMTKYSTANSRITVDKIIVPPISIDSHKSEYEIASHCASVIYQTLLAKL